MDVDRMIDNRLHRFGSLLSLICFKKNLIKNWFQNNFMSPRFCTARISSWDINHIYESNLFSSLVDDRFRSTGPHSCFSFSIIGILHCSVFFMSIFSNTSVDFCRILLPIMQWSMMNNDMYTIMLFFTSGHWFIGQRIFIRWNFVWCLSSVYGLSLLGLTMTALREIRHWFIQASWNEDWALQTMIWTSCAIFYYKRNPDCN
jgi:hypothetical protein